MKKILINLAILIGLAGIAVMTCPDRNAHKEAIMDVLNEKINESLTPTEGKEEITLLASSLGSGIIAYMLDSRMVFKNHFIYSTCDIKKFDGSRTRLSVGVFGHVFTFSKEDLDNALEGATQ